MKKIPTLFVRDPNDMSKLTEQIHPDCQWVLDGEGIATRMLDGTCMMLDDNGSWWQRREVRAGKSSPCDFVEVNYDEVTGKRVGWVPVDKQGYLKPFLEAKQLMSDDWVWMPGTYELIGPKINGNPERLDFHELIKHTNTGRFGVSGVPRSYEEVRDLVRVLGKAGWEGIVWHHPDGRMAKLKARDFKE